MAPLDLSSYKDALSFYHPSGGAAAGTKKPYSFGEWQSRRTFSNGNCELGHLDRQPSESQQHWRSFWSSSFLGHRCYYRRRGYSNRNQLQNVSVRSRVVTKTLVILPKITTATPTNARRGWRSILERRTKQDEKGRIPQDKILFERPNAISAHKRTEIS